MGDLRTIDDGVAYEVVLLVEKGGKVRHSRGIRMVAVSADVPVVVMPDGTIHPSQTGWPPGRYVVARIDQ